MTSSLGDIPDTAPDRDAGHPPPRRRRRLSVRGQSEFARPDLPFSPSGPSDGPTLFREQRKRVEVGTVFAAAVGVGTLVLLGVLLHRATIVEVESSGLDDGAVLNALEAAALEVQWEFDSSDTADTARLSFDGDEIDEPTVEGNRMIWRSPGELDEGEHILLLSVRRPVLDAAEFEWRFTVDATPPELDVPPVAERVDLDAPARVEGSVEPGATLTVDGRDIAVSADGSFTIDFPRPPAGSVVLRAVDSAGNTGTSTVVVPINYPSMRAVHVTAPAWSSELLRGGILQLIDEGRIDTVQIDLKDEGGMVGFNTTVARAREIGAVTEYYDLDELVETLKRKDVRIVGRVVTFRDPMLARAAWNAGQGDQVIQSVHGGPWAAPGEYTNFAHPAVRRYNLDLALDAVGRGVDDILWDDTRRPSGAPETMVVPGMVGSSSDAIVGFLAEAHDALRRRGAHQGVTAVGAAADRGDLVGQDVARMARHTDYLVPIIFPGYWSSGEYDVADPIHQPGELVTAALGHFQKLTKDTGAILAPWLQDFALRGVGYGEAEVRAQIAAADGLGVDRFLLWDPAVTYTAGALDPQE